MLKTQGPKVIKNFKKKSIIKVYFLMLHEIMKKEKQKVASHKFYVKFGPSVLFF